MNNNIQCSIESSTTKIELNSAVEGVFLVPELDGLAGLPDIRTTSGVNAGYDGGWTSAQNYDARLISIRGVIANPDVSKVEAKRRAIASLLGQGRKEQLTLRFTTEAGNAYVISVRTISCEMALQRVLTTQEFLIQLRADDPLIYDDGASSGTEAILQVQKALGGFEINFELPLAIGGGAEDTVVENGSETVYPIINLYGPLHSPTVVNRTTNQQMQILADLQYSISWSGYQTKDIGAYGQLDNEFDGAPMYLSQLTGNAEQTTYSGKNLFDISKVITASNNKVINNGDGTLTVSGYAVAANQPNHLSDYCPTLQVGDTVTLSGNSTSTNSKIIYLYNSGTGEVWNLTGGTKTITQQHLDSIVMWYNSTGDTTVTVKDIQIERGTTATSFEKYVGGTASPNPDYPQAIETVTGGQVVEITGKNLFDGSTRTLGAPSDTAYINTTKRLFDLSTFVSGFTRNNYYAPSNATTTLNSDGSFTITATAGYYGAGFPFRLGAGTYTFSATRSGASSIITMSTYEDDGTYLTAQLSGGNALTFTLTEDTNVLLGIMPESATTITASNIQLELGNSASEFEPYQGQSYEVNLPMLGKNQFRTSTLPETWNNNTAISVPLSLKPNTTYTMSSTIGRADGNAVLFFKTASASIGTNTNGVWSGQSRTATTDETGNNLVIAYRTLNSAEYRRDDYTYQLEEGSSATTYEAPNPLELAKIGIYQDYIWNDGGTWKIHKQVGKLNMTDIAWDGLNGAGSPYSIGFTANYNAKVDVTLSNIFVHDWTAWAGNGKFGIASSGSLWMMTGDSTVDASNAPSWLANKSAVMYYVLATPTTTEITDETLLSQLNFIASLYGGVNNISIVGTGAQGGIVVKHATAKIIDQDVAVIDSQARTITLNGQDIYHLKSEESEFLLLAPGDNKLYLTSEVSDDSGYAEVKFKQGYLSI